MTCAWGPLGMRLFHRSLVAGVMLTALTGGAVAHTEGFKQSALGTGTGSIPAATVAPPGSTGQVIYNSASAFAASSGLTTDGAGRVSASVTLAASGTAPQIFVARDGVATGRLSIINPTGGGTAGLGFSFTNSTTIFTSTAGTCVGCDRLGVLTQPSQTLQVVGGAVSGSFGIPVCNVNLGCTAAQSTHSRSTCFSTVLNTLASCNGANSWVPMVSTTLISASAL